jgi:hypothetical protein
VTVLFLGYLLIAKHNRMFKIKRAESFAFQFATNNVKLEICRDTILAVVWYGCETWSLTLVGGGVVG